MFDELSYKKFVNLAGSCQRIAVYKEIPGDQLTPINAYLALAGFAKEITLLELNPNNKSLGRYSYLCFDPVAVIHSRNQQVTIRDNEKTKTITADPFEVLRTYQSKLFAKTDHPLSGFAGGMVGFMSYDAMRLIEDIPSNNTDEDNIPDTFFRFYANQITFDHHTEKVVISTVTTVNANVDSKTTYEQAIDQVRKISKQLLTYSHDNSNSDFKKSKQKNKPIEEDIDDAAYRKMVEKAKQHIAEGDIFQMVLSRKFSIKTSANPFDIYRAFRYSNPSPYMFYIDTCDFSIAGASPEKLISIKGKAIESCPLAGTSPRYKAQDNAADKALRENKKELAEHMMLVDLSRNDIGAVAVPGSVKVTKLKEIEKYAQVMHISSTTQGLLRNDMDAFDALKASFPAGTVSGAPKIKAMSLIDAFENTCRGIYGGVICAIDAQGNLDSCIAIRTALIKNGTASVRAGAGIVFGSEPQAEADETRHKAQAILEGILLAEEKQP